VLVEEVRAHERRAVLGAGGTELPRKRLELRAAACRENDLVPAEHERPGDGDAEASGGADDEHLTTGLHVGLFTLAAGGNSSRRPP
jgi:hypothetical protein